MECMYTCDALHGFTTFFSLAGGGLPPPGSSCRGVFVRMFKRGLLVNRGRGCSSVGKASDWHPADASSIPRCGEGFFSQRQLSVQTLPRCPYSPRVQSHVLIYVRTLKIPSIGSQTFVWTHEKKTHAVRLLLPYRGSLTEVRRPEFPVKDK